MALLHDQKKLSICIVTNNYTPYSGGVVSSIRAFAQGLREMGHQVSIVTLDFTGDHDAEPGVIRIFSPLRFTYKNNRMAIPWRATKALESILLDMKPDIVHSQHPFLLGAAALSLCKQLSIPILFTHHTQYAAYAHYVPLPAKITQPVINRMVEQYAREVDAVIAPSSMVRNELISRGINTPIQVLPSPLLPMFMDGEAKSVHAGKKIKLLTVSRFTKEKSIPFLFDAISLLQKGSYSFTLVGYGSELESLKRYAYEHCKLSADDVQFIVRPPKEQLVELYRNSDLFVFASQTETQGLVIAEAMASGLPVIARRAAALEDVVINGENGYLISSSEEMAQQVKNIVERSDLMRLLSDGAHSTGQLFSQQKLSGKLSDIYRELLQ